MIRGSCLCGTVTFEFREATGRFPFCHCNRCRKFTGSAFFAALLARGLVFLSGEDSIRSFEAPILIGPPPYRKDFCVRCGSPVPWPTGQEDEHAVPAGVLDDDPIVRPEGHVWVNQAAPWFHLGGSLPTFTDAQYILSYVRQWDEQGEAHAPDGYRYLLAHYPNAADVVEFARRRLAELGESA